MPADDEKGQQIVQELPIDESLIIDDKPKEESKGPNIDNESSGFVTGNETA